MSFLHLGSLLNFRTVVTVLGLIFSIAILSDARKVYRYPWAFGFIAVRLLLSVGLRGLLVLGIPMDPHVPEVVKAIAAVLDLLTLIAMWLGYGTVFDETPLRKWIRKWWPFK